MNGTSFYIRGNSPRPQLQEDYKYLKPGMSLVVESGTNSSAYALKGKTLLITALPGFPIINTKIIASVGHYSGERKISIQDINAQVIAKLSNEMQNINQIKVGGRYVITAIRDARVGRVYPKGTVVDVLAVNKAGGYIKIKNAGFTSGGTAEVYLKDIDLEPVKTNELSNAWGLKEDEAERAVFFYVREFGGSYIGGGKQQGENLVFTLKLTQRQAASLEREFKELFKSKRFYSYGFVSLTKSGTNYILTLKRNSFNKMENALDTRQLGLLREHTTKALQATFKVSSSMKILKVEKNPSKPELSRYIFEVTFSKPVNLQAYGASRRGFTTPLDSALKAAGVNLGKEGYTRIVDNKGAFTSASEKAHLYLINLGSDAINSAESLVDRIENLLIASFNVSPVLPDQLQIGKRYKVAKAKGRARVPGMGSSDYIPEGAFVDLISMSKDYAGRITVNIRYGGLMVRGLIYTEDIVFYPAGVRNAYEPNNLSRSDAQDLVNFLKDFVEGIGRITDGPDINSSNVSCEFTSGNSLSKIKAELKEEQRLWDFEIVDLRQVGSGIYYLAITA